MLIIKTVFKPVSKIIIGKYSLRLLVYTVFENCLLSKFRRLNLLLQYLYVVMSHSNYCNCKQLL